MPHNTKYAHTEIRLASRRRRRGDPDHPSRDDVVQSLRKEPRHDQYSQAADAFRTAEVMIRKPERKKEQEKRRPAGTLSPWS
jgi:hypothetical protein